MVLMMDEEHGFEGERALEDEKRSREAGVGLLAGEHFYLAALFPYSLFLLKIPHGFGRCI